MLLKEFASIIFPAAYYSENFLATTPISQGSVLMLKFLNFRDNINLKKLK